MGMRELCLVRSARFLFSCVGVVPRAYGDVSLKTK
jgi:hypothetical protein